MLECKWMRTDGSSPDFCRRSIRSWRSSRWTRFRTPACCSRKTSSVLGTTGRRFATISCLFILIYHFSNVSGLKKSCLFVPFGIWFLARAIKLPLENVPPYRWDKDWWQINHVNHFRGRVASQLFSRVVHAAVPLLPADRGRPGDVAVVDDRQRV